MNGFKLGTGFMTLISVQPSLTESILVRHWVSFPKEQKSTKLALSCTNQSDFRMYETLQLLFENHSRLAPFDIIPDHFILILYRQKGHLRAKDIFILSWQTESKQSYALYWSGDGKRLGFVTNCLDAVSRANNCHNLIQPRTAGVPDIFFAST